MFTYKVSNDKVMKIIRKWCKDNSYSLFFDDKDTSCIYPTKINAPSSKKSELEEHIVNILDKEDTK